LSVKICQSRWLSRRGVDYLKRLQAQAGEQSKSAVWEPGIESPSLTLLVAVLGLGALKGTPYASYVKVLAVQGSSGDSFTGGGGCGGGGGGCGGGN
jgi:hypothetical protein